MLKTRNDFIANAIQESLLQADTVDGADYLCCDRAACKQEVQPRLAAPCLIRPPQSEGNGMHRIAPPRSGS